MTNIDPQHPDALGARASNAGDQFHELWALQQALELLNPASGLSAVTVEGVATETKESDRSAWDGVDCTLYFGGQLLETATRIDIAQHKYSTTDPDTSWTIARLAANKRKTGNNSPFRRLADAFIAARKVMLPTASLRVLLVSNQNVAVGVFEAIQAITQTPASGIDLDLADDVQTIKSATGLDGQDLTAFLQCLDFSECGKSTRSSIRGAITQYVGQVLGDNESGTVRELMTQIRELMMPGHSRTVIVRKMILSWFGVATETGLFPAPSDFKPLNQVIHRNPTAQLVAALEDGVKVVCLHGAAGCGKTTALRQLDSVLPSSSVLFLFDCYGGGRYLFSNDRRHLPEHAFTQIANELSLKIGIPFLLARGSNTPLMVRRFLDHLKLAAELFARAYPEALLVLGIDAADNSVTAATKPDPHDPCFVTELATADLSILPDNVRLVFSARTVRKDIGIKPRSALSVLNLMHLKGVSWDMLFAKAGSLASSDYSDPFAHQLVPLWGFLLLRTDSRDFVLASISAKRDGIRLAREPAADKVNAAVEFSRLSLNFSEPDARAFFEEAIELTQQIDREAMNQIEVIHALTAHSTHWPEDARLAAAPVTVNVFTEIAERLRNEDHFPWEGSMNSLVRLHAPTALAAVARWSDQGTHGLSDSLRLFLEEALRLEALSPTAATSLLALLDYVPAALEAKIVDGLRRLGEPIAMLVLEELANGCLLLANPTSIAVQAGSLLKAARPLKGSRLPAFRRLVETFHYLDAREAKPKKEKLGKRSTPALAGGRFTSAAAIEAEYNAARKDGGGFDTATFLNQMIAVTVPGDRVAFLDALSAAVLGSYSESSRASVILAALSAWQSTPSVEQWRTKSLPTAIVNNFAGLVSWYYGRHHATHLIQLLSATNLAAQDQLGIIAEALETIGLSLGGDGLFGIAELMAGLLSPQEALEIFDWYLRRLNDRVQHDESDLTAVDLPDTLEASIGRFLFALMSDIDNLRELWPDH
ncbi:MAG: hypothetical protein WDN50_12430 [Bradyrhizobium sp.]